ncbi:MAG TPA: hypothetical protein ENJ32_08950 [Crenotrichaceae bacterium]|nr:hypothetical protein [Crenotrichaceae bacterium]
MTEYHLPGDSSFTYPVMLTQLDWHQLLLPSVLTSALLQVIARWFSDEYRILGVTNKVQDPCGFLNPLIETSDSK